MLAWLVTPRIPLRYPKLAFGWAVAPKVKYQGQMRDVLYDVILGNWRKAGLSLDRS